MQVTLSKFGSHLLAVGQYQQNGATMRKIELLLNDSRGVYIPRDFCEGFDLQAWGIDPDCWQVKACLDPECDLYWEAWEEVCYRAKYRHGGKEWFLHQDGDLWAICYEMLTDEDKENFGFED